MATRKLHTHGLPNIQNISGNILAELEKKLYPNLIKYIHIQYIARYDENVFIIYYEAGSTAEETLQDHNSKHPGQNYNTDV